MEDLHLFGDWDMEWEVFITGLNMEGIRIYDWIDSITWSLNKKRGDVIASLAYNELVEQHLPKYLTWWMSWVWKGKLRTKI